MTTPVQGEFIEFLARTGALKFGDFTLKSGRKSPYFVNLGGFDDGSSVRRLGRFFAARIAELVPGGFDFLFGPAYKGIPLAVATAVAFDADFSRNVPFTYNRKEAKAHGDAGYFVGHKPSAGERAVLVDDVFTTGETKVEAVEALSKAGASVAGVVIAVDRGEVGQDGDSAIDSFVSSTGIPVGSIISIRDITSHLHGRAVGGKVLLDDAMKARIDAYLREWGAPGFRG